MSEEKPLDLEAIEARAAKATPGPWVNADGPRLRLPDGELLAKIKGYAGTQEDAAFIAAARTDVPALCAEVRRLRAALDESKRLFAETVATLEKAQAQGQAAMFVVPIQTTTGLNAREPWPVRARRVKQERVAVARYLRKALGVPRWKCSGVVSLPCVVTLTRVGPRECDSDNLQGAMKGVRDAVAAYLGVDDGSDWITWRYEQRRGEWGVEVRISSFP